jgi:hypothetical protein
MSMVGYGWIPQKNKLSVAELELLGDRLISRQIRVVKIVQQRAPLADHFQQPPAGAVVFGVLLQMLGEVIDSLCQQSDLHIRGPCVRFVQLEPRYRLSFFHISDSIN